MKTKKILLFIIIILVIIIVALCTIYYNTDIFKTTTEKFWKYARANTHMVEMFSSEGMQSIKNRRSSNAYEVNSSLSIRNSEKSYLLESNTNANNANDVTTDVNFQYNNANVLNFTLVKKSNIVGIKLDELANGFIAIKNNEITKLAKEAGIEDTSNIPENINWTSMLDLLYIQPSDQKYFAETYSELIRDYTTKKNYSEEKIELKIDDDVHPVTAYKLELTENESKNIVKQVLVHARDEDSRMINFISSRLKLLNLPKKYTDYEAVKSQISQLIEKIDSMECSDEKLVEITIFVENKNVIQTNIKVKDGSAIKIVPQDNGRKLCVMQESKNDYLDKSKNKIFKYIGNIERITISNETAQDGNSSLIKLDARFYNKLNIEYNSRIVVGTSGKRAVEFEETPRIVLNEMESEKLKQTYEKIVYGLKIIYQNKFKNREGLNFLGIQN